MFVNVRLAGRARFFRDTNYASDSDSRLQEITLLGEEPRPRLSRRRQRMGTCRLHVNCDIVDAQAGGKIKVRRGTEGWILFMLVALLQVPAWGSPASIGPEFQVNTYTTNRQYAPSIATRGANNFVVVWEGYGEHDPGFDILGRLLDSGGKPLGSEFQVSTYTGVYAAYPAAAMDSAGDFLVVWDSQHDGSGHGVFGRSFDSSGNPRGPEFQVNTYTTNDQRHSSVTATSSGEFVVVWESFGQDGFGFGIFGRLFDSTGVPLGPEFQVNTHTTYSQRVPSIAGNDSGDFVVVWQSGVGDGSGYGLLGQRFDRTATRVGSEFRVNAYTPGDQFSSKVAMDDSGRFTVVWVSRTSSQAVFGRQFDSDGVPQGPDLPLSTTTAYAQNYPAIATSDSGHFTVVWQSGSQDGSEYGVFGRRFAAVGPPSEPEFQVNTYTTNDQAFASIATNETGDFIVTWQSYGQDGSNLGVFGRRFQRSPLVISPLSGATLDCSDPRLSRPTIVWDAEGYDRFRVLFSSNAGFTNNATVSSGDTLLRATFYTPPSKKWRTACAKAIAGNPWKPVLFIEVFGVDLGLSKHDPARKRFGPAVQVDVGP
jgi:hypothetical protein